MIQCHTTPTLTLKTFGNTTFVMTNIKFLSYSSVTGLSALTCSSQKNMNARWSEIENASYLRYINFQPVKVLCFKMSWLVGSLYFLPVHDILI